MWVQICAVPNRVPLDTGCLLRPDGLRVGHFAVLSQGLRPGLHYAAPPELKGADWPKYAARAELERGVLSHTR